MAQPTYYTGIVDELRRNFDAGILNSLESRLDQLHQIERMLTENRNAFEEGLFKDLHKHQYEGYIAEIMGSIKEVRVACNNLKIWMKPAKVSGGLIHIMDTLEIHKEPLGVVLVMAAWNYPLGVVLQPLIGAIAAGNCVVVKPSDLAVHTAALLETLMPKYLKAGVAQVINGGIPETTALLKCRFDHIIYTGSSQVGKIVMRAAADHLTPVTLELGGKTPTIVDTTCDFDLVGKRIAWGKFFNMGQTCIGVDYVLCVGGCQDRLLEAIKKATLNFFGEEPHKSPSYGRIINNRHFHRLVGMIDDDRVVYGNERNEEDLYISPTILANVESTDRIMQNEIFGPILALMNVASVEEAIKFIKTKEKPLTLYVFSNDKSVCSLVQNQTSSGSMLINDTLMQFGAPLPFGGVGASGMGAYHGKFSFDCFSHHKSVMKVKQTMEAARNSRYPPYDAPGKEKELKQLEWLAVPKLQKGWSISSTVLVVCCVVVVGMSMITPYLGK